MFPELAKAVTDVRGQKSESESESASEVGGRRSEVGGRKNLFGSQCFHGIHEAGAASGNQGCDAGGDREQ